MHASVQDCDCSKCYEEEIHGSGRAYVKDSLMHMELRKDFCVDKHAAVWGDQVNKGGKNTSVRGA